MDGNCRRHERRERLTFAERYANAIPSAINVMAATINAAGSSSFELTDVETAAVF